MIVNGRNRGVRLVPTEIFTLVGIVLTGGATWLAARVKARSDRETARIAGDNPGWKSFTEEMRAEHAEQKEWMKDQLAARDRRIDDLKDDVSRLKRMVTNLEEKYRAALYVIRQFKREHPNTVVVVPSSIGDDL